MMVINDTIHIAKYVNGSDKHNTYLNILPHSPTLSPPASVNKR